MLWLWHGQMASPLQGPAAGNVPSVQASTATGRPTSRLHPKSQGRACGRACVRFDDEMGKALYFSKGGSTAPTVNSREKRMCVCDNNSPLPLAASFLDRQIAYGFWQEYLS